MACTSCAQRRVQATRLQQFRTATMAIGRVAIGLVRNREVFSDTEMVKERLRLCARCENVDKHSKKCLQCGCLLSLKVKLREERCPIDRWKPIT